MARLAVRKLKYSGDLYEYESPTLNDGLNIIEGPNGSGKSTFAELIYFCLSGNPDMLHAEKSHKHKEIFSDHNNYVEILLQIENELYVISRFVRSNDITIRAQDGSMEILPVFRSKNNHRIFSDWLLERISIEAVELALGATSWKLNIRDLMRLQYHDQAPNPMQIYKEPESSGFIEDSKTMRKAIFEVLLGKSFHEYYGLLGQLRDAESQRSKAKGAVELYRNMLEEIHKKTQDANLISLKAELDERTDQLNRLEIHYNAIASVPTMPQQMFSKVEQLKAEMLEVQLTSTEKEREESAVLDEIEKLKRVQTDLMVECTQIKKMVYTHEKLSLFSADTCPYCLREVQRTRGKCVCGSDVDETQYERFFYSSAEYVDILKSKQKSVETVEKAIVSAETELKAIQNSIIQSETRANEIKDAITKRINESDRTVDIARAKEVANKIAQLRGEITKIEQQLALENKRQDLEDKLQAADTSQNTLMKRAQKLFADANLEMDARIKDFNEIYNALMKKCVKDCRRAYLDPDYMPVINDGEYREASAAVPRRLLYFFTLLRMSLLNQSVKFPRFLLVDTPETSGIDKDKLLKTLECLEDIIPEKDGNQYQMILLTGIGKYPEKYRQYVRQTLAEDSMLLIKREEKPL